MKSFGRAVCPYCGKKVNLAATWGLRRRGEYRCPRCQGISNVTLSGATMPLAFVAIALSALLLVGSVVLLPQADWWVILVVAAPFVVFYILSLFCVQLKKPVLRRTSPAPRPTPSQEPQSREDLEKTRVL